MTSRMGPAHPIARAAVVAALFVTAGPATAQAACPLAYPVFEFAVAHLDLERCPAGLAREKAFCRATTGNDAVHVFVFAAEGDQCLLAVRSFGAGEYALTLK